MNDLQKKMLIRCRNKAKELGGKCLSTSYASGRVKLNWWCRKHNFTWAALPDNVLSKSAWCKSCSNEKISLERRGSFAEVRSGAKKANIKILSKESEYKNNKSRLKVQCQSCSKIYLKSVWQIKIGSSCNFCKSEKTSATKIAKSKLRVFEELKRRNIELQSDYRGVRVPSAFSCQICGCKWRTPPYNIVGKKKTGCPSCSAHRGAESSRIGIERMQQIAIERGGRCLSPNYENNAAYLYFVCKFGHKWKASAAPIISGGWCPECGAGLGERLCRATFEQLFGRQFPKIRPEWLRGKKGRKLELDGYCEEIGVAFEHQGEHHFRQRYFTKESKKFNQVKDNDMLKRRLCKKYSVRLIAVPEINNLLPLSTLKEFIIKECRRQKIRLPKAASSKVIEYLEAYCPDKYGEIRKLAERNGGRLLSSAYLGVKAKHLFQCGKGHEWLATPDTVKQGYWCRVCKGNAAITIEMCKSKGVENGGKLLSRIYKGNRVKMKWQCREGHFFHADWHSVGRGSWCRLCGINRGAAKLRDNIETFRKIISARGGKCLSSTYKNQSSRIKVKCGDCGHVWMAYPSSLKQGRWCQKCAWVKNGIKLRK